MEYKISKTKKFSVVQNNNLISISICQPKKEAHLIVELPTSDIEIEAIPSTKDFYKGFILKINHSFFGRYYLGIDADSHRYIRKTLLPICQLFNLTKISTKGIMKKFNV